MEDSRIVALYWERKEQAITETDTKYGRYCFTIANNILYSREDAYECVNDTYLNAWDAMPPHRPKVLSTFLGKITRRISLNRWRDKTREKRGGGEVPLALEELSDCISSEQTVEQTLEYRELTKAIRSFLSTLSDNERDLFLCRYWFFASISELGVKFGFSESKVKSMLLRTRRKLERCLKEEGLL